MLHTWRLQRSRAPPSLPLVPVLGRTVRPPKVPGLVVAIVVDAIQRPAGGQRPQRLFEIPNERAHVMPLGGHADSPSSVVSIPRGLRIVAPIHHVAPTRIVGVLVQPVNGGAADPPDPPVSDVIAGRARYAVPLHVVLRTPPPRSGHLAAVRHDTLFRRNHVCSIGCRHGVRNHP